MKFVSGKYPVISPAGLMAVGAVVLVEPRGSKEVKIPLAVRTKPLYWPKDGGVLLK
jgi:hypothetical protein